jgi:uncharacterized protein (TIGR00106 family)
MMMDCAEEPAWRWWSQGLGMTAGCELFALNRTLSLLAATSQHSRAVAVTKCKTVLTQAGLKVQLHPNGTAIEGEWEPVFAAIEACHQAVHAMGCPRIYTTVKINTRTDKVQTLEDKVASVQALL